MLGNFKQVQFFNIEPILGRSTSYPMKNGWWIMSFQTDFYCVQGSCKEVLCRDTFLLNYYYRKT